ncbi:tRNA wybutosine-synthesizing protein 2 [Chamberlinius hualienensis]
MRSDRDYRLFVTHKRNCQKLRDFLKDKGWLYRKRKLFYLGDERVVLGVIADVSKNELISSVDFELEEYEDAEQTTDEQRVGDKRKLSRALRDLIGADRWDDEWEAEAVAFGWERHGDLIVLDQRAFQGQRWAPYKDDVEFWKCVAHALKASRLASGHRVLDDDYRSPGVRLLLGDDPMVTHVDNGIKYTFDVTKCMFSSGNITEKLRISQIDCSDEVVVDLFAGIGYFTLPYLVHAKAKFVHACEWNPEAFRALERNLILNRVNDRCRIYFGDNRTACPVGVAQRVNLGLIPSSEISWETACRALDPVTGGVLHVHANVDMGEKGEEKVVAYARIAQHVADGIQRNFQRVDGERRWSVKVAKVGKVKWYAPRVQHVVCDVNCHVVSVN